MDAHTGSKRNTSLIGVLCLLTALFLLWPCYRSFLNVDIDINEGWNAYFADAAWGRMPLYPATDQLITNNYPPLSFYVVGGVGRLLGDNILAGRLISLAAILILAIILYLLLRHWKTSQTAAFVSCVYFVAIMCRFFTGYAGMNDPQLLAQCVMAAGLLLFLRAMETGKSLLIPVVIMVVAGFIKHNIIAMPVTAFIWLVWQQPRRLPMALVIGAVTAGAGLVLCHWWYGPEFFTNLLAARIHDWRHAVGAIGHLQWVAVGLAVWLYIGITCWSLKSIQFCNLFVMISLVTFFMQKMGDGVAHNAMFDLVIATSMALGLAYEYSPLTPLARWYSPVLLRNVLIVAICARLLISTRLEPFRLFVDPSFRTELAIKEAEMEKAIERIQNTPGDVAGSTYACYRAGKPFIIDPFGISQRIRSGTVPANVVSERVREKRLTIIMVKQLHD